MEEHARHLPVVVDEYVVALGQHVHVGRYGGVRRGEGEPDDVSFGFIVPRPFVAPDPDVHVPRTERLSLRVGGELALSAVVLGLAVVLAHDVRRGRGVRD